MDKPSKSANKNPSKKEAKNWIGYSSMAFEFFAIIGIFTAVGLFLDKKLHTNPILLIVFLLVGLIASFYRVFKQFS